MDIHEVSEKKIVVDKAAGLQGAGVVGIGASAGGLAAIESFFSGFANFKAPNLAFVIVQHLSPSHATMLVDIVSRFTHFKVQLARSGMAVAPNNVYVMPPNSQIEFREGCLFLSPLSEPRGLNLPIDHFLSSLAQLEKKAICVILSGSGKDGAQGAKLVGESGGLVIAQSSETAEYSSMPRSVISSGSAHFELAPANMALKILTYASSGFVSVPPPINSDKLAVTREKIFELLHKGTGHDFSQHKPQTVQRRIYRQMALHRIKDLNIYLNFLRDSPDAVIALYQDLLIGVTSFFRDPEVFTELREKVIPKILRAKEQNETVRIWSVGCSTGEEAYSLAILTQECLDQLNLQKKVSIFATDLDERAIARARLGQFSRDIEKHLSPDRLNRFFSLDVKSNKYQVKQKIRDLIVFSAHNLLKDPPFSRIDLLSCRNLLIYFNANIQNRVMEIFHYAINPGGALLLGTSEGVGKGETFFTPINSKLKIFAKADGKNKLFSKPAPVFLPTIGLAKSVTSSIDKGIEMNAKQSFRQTAEQILLQQIAPISALVNNSGDLLYLHGRAGLYLEPVTGEIGTNNLLKMAREGLREGLAIVLRKAIESKAIEYMKAQKVKSNGHHSFVDVTVRPVFAEGVSEEQQILFLVSFEEATSPADVDLAELKKNANLSAENADLLLGYIESINSLQNEVKVKENYIRQISFDLENVENANKQLASELQSTKEEQQSTNEELETSKEELQSINEELQSVNEELSTLNAELNSKIEDLSALNNDMNNLLSGTGIATVFLNKKLSILRFTPTVRDIINLIPSDIGRPIGDIVSKLENYHQLSVDAQEVLETLKAKELEVKSSSGPWYLMRIRPYRTLENVIEGVVISFIDISDFVEIRANLKKAHDDSRLAVVVRDSVDAVSVHDLSGKILAWNMGATKLYGWSEEEALKMNIADRVPQNRRETELENLLRLGKNEMIEAYRSERLKKDGKIVSVTLATTALRNKSGEVYAISTIERLAADKNRNIGGN